MSTTSEGTPINGNTNTNTNVNTNASVNTNTNGNANGSTNGNGNANGLGGNTQTTTCGNIANPVAPNRTPNWQETAIALSNKVDELTSRLTQTNLLNDEFRKRHDEMKETQMMLLLNLQNSNFNRFNSPVPVFNGRINEDVDSWIYTVESAFESSRIAEPSKVTLISGYVRELAQDTFRRMKTENPNLT